MFVLKYKKWFLGISIALCIGALAAVGLFGLKPSIDFTGGTIVEVVYINERPTIERIKNNITFEGASVRFAGEKGVIVRLPKISEKDHAVLLSNLSEKNTYQIIEKRRGSIDPVLGEELVSKAYVTIITVIFAIVVFIAFAFRKVSRPIASWKYGLVAIVALIHDVIIPVGVFAFLGQFLGAEVDVLFITALLTILGISINDTIVVFDRIRENLRVNGEHGIKESFEDTVGKSLEQTFARSIATSATVIIVLIALYVLGGETTQYFALTLIVGMFAGTYSSIFIASPILVLLEKNQKKQ